MRIIIFLLMLMPLIGLSQNNLLPPYYGVDSVKKYAFGHDSTSHFISVGHYVYIIDSTGISGISAKRNSYGNWEVMDAQKALETIYKSYQELLEDKELQYKQLSAAQKILSFTRMDGSIINWKKWSEAVREYQKLIQPPITIK